MKVIQIKPCGIRRIGAVYECTTQQFEIMQKVGWVKKYEEECTLNPANPTKSAPVNTEIQSEPADIAGNKEESAAEPAGEDTISEPADEQPDGVEETSAVRKTRRKRNTEPTKPQE